MTWYEHDRTRYEAEKIAVRKYYPRVRIFMKRKQLILLLKVQGRKRSYMIQVVYPNDFPFDRPKAYCVKPNIRNAPHLYKDGRLSIHGDYESSRTSGKNVLDWAKKWLEAYENWLDTGKWSERIK